MSFIGPKSRRAPCEQPDRNRNNDSRAKRTTTKTFQNRSEVTNTCSIGVENAALTSKT